MSNSVILLRSILCPVRPCLRPLSLAGDITRGLIFTQYLHLDDIRVTKLVYPDVAKLLHCKPTTAARRIQRLSHLCRDALVQRDLLIHYLGRVPGQEPNPGSLLGFLAVYLQVPFFTLVDNDPRTLFYLPNCSPPVSALPPPHALPVSQIRAFPSFDRISVFPVCPACHVSLERVPEFL